jgi:uncharacterized repeat protein (TIGR01451 family)
MKRHTSNISDSGKRYRWFLTCFLASVVLLFIAMSGSASAANIVVNSLADPGAAGQCTLRKAIGNANADGGAGTSADCAAGTGADTITFSVAGTITLGSTLPTITDVDGLTIDGGSVVAISGNHSVTAFIVNSGASLTLENLTVKDCNAGIFTGGGIANGGTLTIINSTLSGNSASEGGAICCGTITITNSTLSGNSATIGGGVYNSNAGTLTITNSTLSGNSATGSGGAIYNDSNSGTVTITNSTLSGNSADSEGGGIFNQAGGTVTITNSTLSGNSADGEGGGIFNDDGSTVTITNSTLSGNSAATGNGGGIRNDGTLTVTNSTLSGNSAPDTGGIYNVGTVAITNSIVANSPGGDCSNAGTFTAIGNNLDTDGSCPGFTQVTSTDLNLGPLFDNGGPTRTHALISPSAAIDKGSQSECAAHNITTDQRGFLRDIHCDIGAYELGAQAEADLLISKAVNKTSVKQGDLLTYTTTVQNFGPNTAVNVVVNDTLSSGTTFVSASANKGTFTKPAVGHSGVVTWYIGDMLDEDQEAATIVVKVLVKGKTTITNTATVSSDTADPNPANNTASITVSVAPGTTKK